MTYPSHNSASFQRTVALGTKVRQVFTRDIIRRKRGLRLFYARGRDNIGDSMVPWIVNAILGRDIPYGNPREARGPHLLTIGSILNFADEESIVWGSGFIEAKNRPHALPANIAALRGPLTASRIEQLGGPKITLFGDPAILTPKYIQPRAAAHDFEIGFIPHYADKAQFDLLDLDSIGRHHVCDVETSSIQQFVDELHRCRVIVSSSLHGIIIAEAFGIPSVWMQLSSHVVGDGFKFRDYYASTGRCVEPIGPGDLSRDRILLSIPSKPNGLGVMADYLKEAFPIA